MKDLIVTGCICLAVFAGTEVKASNTVLGAAVGAGVGSAIGRNSNGRDNCNNDDNAQVRKRLRDGVHNDDAGHRHLSKRHDSGESAPDHFQPQHQWHPRSLLLK